MALKEPFCSICRGPSRQVFKARVLHKYEVAYFQCDACGFVQTEEPYWLDEAYHSSITASDTGSLLRSLSLAEIISVLIYFFFDRNARYLDFAGGHGVFTRRMRDIGFDFYWQDRYSPNLFARGFEYTAAPGPLELTTSFESFEHFSDPLLEIESMLSLSKTIIFTTELLPNPLPRPEEWYYYGLHHGQHLSFYSLQTLRFIADKFGLKYYSVNPVQILTAKSLSFAMMRLLLRMRRFGLFFFVKRRMEGKTVSDSVELTGRDRC